MSYEKIDEASAVDSFDDIKNTVLRFAKVISPDIAERVKLEKKLAKLLKINDATLTLNFIIECINGTDGHRSEEKDSSESDLGLREEDETKS